MDNPRILLVEDDQLVRIMIADVLRDEGFEVVEVATGDDAATQLEDVDDFDLLFTDVRMPGNKDGIDVAVQARELDPKIAVIVASGYAPDLVERLDVLDPPAVFFRKPYRPREIVEVVRQLVN